MAYTFTAAEQAELTALYEAGPTPTNSGNFSAFYQRMSEILQRENAAGSSPDDDPAVYNVRLWLDVATGANANEGLQSAFIRTYTNRQALLRLGREFTPEEMQEASNQVARNLFESLRVASWTLPTIDVVAKADAKAIGDVLFGPALVPCYRLRKPAHSWRHKMAENIPAVSMTTKGPD